MISPSFFLLMSLLTVCSAHQYVKPNYPKIPLSKEENQNLQKNCSRPPIRKHHQKVWNPEFVNRTEAPWAVAVGFARKWEPGMNVSEMYNHVGSVCSGTLISSRHVLTAAHCIQPNVLRTFFVIDVQCGFNTTKCKGEPMYLRQASRVFSSIRYKELNGPNSTKSNGGDMAVYELTEDIPFSENVWPSCLGDGDIEIGENLDLYGYGTHGIGNPTWALQHASINAEKCKHEDIFDIFCSYMSYQKPCGGDSGAGLIQTDSHGLKSVVATHTAGNFCEDANSETVFGPNEFLKKQHTMVKPHLYWICEATGICVNEQIQKDVEIWTNLPNRHRERYVTLEVLDEDKIYV